jgi:hypothetical protein
VCAKTDRETSFAPCGMRYNNPAWQEQYSALRELTVRLKLDKSPAGGHELSGCGCLEGKQDVEGFSRSGRTKIRTRGWLWLLRGWGVMGTLLRKALRTLTCAG